MNIISVSSIVSAYNVIVPFCHYCGEWKDRIIANV